MAALARKIESPAKDIFATVRGYPERRGEAEAQMGAIRQPIERCQLAAHQLCERIIRLKVQMILCVDCSGMSHALKGGAADEGQ